MWEDYNKSKISRLMTPDEHLVRFIQKNFPDKKLRKNIKTLDVGFASGRHLVYFAKQGFDVYGFDNSKESLKLAKEWLAKEKLTAQIIDADALNLPYKNNSFDVAVEIGMIEHFFRKDRERAVSEIYRVLKPGGLFFFNVKKRGDHLDASGQEIEKNTYLLDKPSIKNIPIRFEGACHFFDKADITGLLKSFRKLDLNYLVFTRNNMEIKIQNWIIIAKK